MTLLLSKFYILSLFCFSRIHQVDTVKDWLRAHPQAVRKEPGQKHMMLQPEEVMFWTRQTMHCAEQLVATPVSAHAFRQGLPADLIYKATR